MYRLVQKRGGSLYVCIPPGIAEEMGVDEDDYVEVKLSRRVKAGMSPKMEVRKAGEVSLAERSRSDG